MIEYEELHFIFYHSCFWCSLNRVRTYGEDRKKSEITSQSPQGTSKTIIDQNVEPGSEIRTSKEKIETQPDRELVHGSVA